jgi:tetratricopeptide (TPR) repeat protein
VAIPFAAMLLTEADIKWDLRRTQDMYGLANQAIKALAQSDKSKPEVQHLLARAAEFDGLYFAETASAETNAQQMQDDLAKATGYYSTALTQLGQLKDRFDRTSGPNRDWRWLRSLGLVQMAMGDLLLTGFGNADEAGKYYQLSHDTWTRLTVERPNDREITYQLDWTDNKLGDVLLAQGHDDLALRQFEKAEREISPLIVPFDTDQKWLAFLAVVRNNVGINKAAGGRYKDALDAFRRAAENLDTLTAHDAGQNTWLSTFAWTHENIGETEMRWARETKNVSLLDEAERDLRRAGLERGQLTRNADSPRLQSDLFISQANLTAEEGIKLELAHDCRGAADAYVRAALALPPAVRDERTDATILLKAEFLEWAATDYRKSGDDLAAADELRDALSMIANHVLKFSGREASFTAMKQRLEQDLQTTAQTGPGVCG